MANKNPLNVFLSKKLLERENNIITGLCNKFGYNRETVTLRITDLYSYKRGPGVEVSVSGEPLISVSYSSAMRYADNGAKK